jgi:hypothetical protein
VGILTVFDCSVLVMGTVVVMVMVWLWVWGMSVRDLGVVTAESLTVVRLVGVFDATAVRTAQRMVDRVLKADRTADSNDDSETISDDFGGQNQETGRADKTLIPRAWRRLTSLGAIREPFQPSGDWFPPSNCGRSAPRDTTCWLTGGPHDCGTLHLPSSVRASSETTERIVGRQHGCGFFHYQF